MKRGFGVWMVSACGALSACGEDGDGVTFTEEGAPSALEPGGAAELLEFECRENAAKSSSAPETSSARSFRDSERTIGVAVSAARLAEPAYAQTIASQFNQVTPENEMKWETIEPSPGVFDFAPADAIVEFARDNGMQVRGHTLVWHSQLPGWVDELSGADAIRAAMTRHIQTVVGHFRDAYPGIVVAWDVVNEAIDAPGGMAGHRDTVFYRELGAGFIAEAFQIARDADPQALLFYNDFGIEGMFGGKATATFEMVSGLVASGVPIDGIGFQMHTVPDDRGPGFVEFQGNVERYAELGLAIDITEMDVTLCGIGNSEFALEAQRFRYNRLVSACFASSACRAISLWGVGDANSWLNDTGCGAAAVGILPMPLAFDDAYARKPAWWGIYDALTGCSYR
jgi:endo-1,4-beta-xylanase